VVEVPFELVGCEVWRTAFDYQVRLTLRALAPDERPRADAELIIETPFLLCDPEKDWHEVDPGTVETLSPVLRLWRSTVTTVDVNERRALFLEFSDGHRLVVTPDRTYESWALTGSGVRNMLVGPRDQ
jgi:hypothetical protein